MAKVRILEYSVFLEPAEEGGYIARVPAIPGCVTEGETIEEAVALAKDAAEGCLAVLIEEGEPIPDEREMVIQKINVGAPTEPVRLTEA